MNIMKSMEQNKLKFIYKIFYLSVLNDLGTEVYMRKFKESNEINSMEKVYKTMKSVGASDLVFGILLIVFGIGAGVTIIVNGARLIHGKSKIMF